ncbi:undecaprenyl/decaprenyl-phosphate alpha-N-acetylglucosaminyl 1-phosphate transferase [Gammaproteobacteria bacterium]|nr:undecaprenyl/decaprenyl-phosphate alpha-N-acetylglucosaminyl 1-phosphate transferase [Gammaproteobacteria bacterium]
MEITIIIDYLIISIIASIAINSILGNYAKTNNILVDIPDRSRKFHSRPTPLTGGVGIFIGLVLSGKLYIDLNNLNGYVPEFTYYLMVSSLPILVLFLIDDYKGLKVSQRLLIQACITLFMIYTTGIQLESFGNLLGFGSINLGILSIPVTIFCVVGMMNAFNMIDGINGLCSGCAMTSLLLIGFHSGFIYDSMLILIIGSMIGFLIFNLRIFGKKRGVFLGDSGSNLIGFWVAWSAIYCSQNVLYDCQPITMIWFVAIPLLDCIGLIFARLKKGLSISSPGRDHIHHKLMNKYSPEGTLGIILLISLITGLIGIFLNNNFSPWISTYLFILYGSGYYLYSYYYANIKFK